MTQRCWRIDAAGHMRRTPLRALALLCAAWLSYACTGSTTTMATSEPALDTRFLKEQPYARQKQTVDLRGVKADELPVIKDAINPIMRFMVSLPGWPSPRQRHTPRARSIGCASPRPFPGPPPGRAISTSACMTGRSAPARLP